MNASAADGLFWALSGARELTKATKMQNGHTAPRILPAAPCHKRHRPQYIFKFRVI